MPTDKVTGIALIAEKVQEITGISNKKKCAELVKAVFTAISQTLVEEKKVKIKGFGTFKLRETVRRTYNLPQNRGKVEVPPHTVVRFTAHSSLNGLVNLIDENKD